MNRSDELRRRRAQRSQKRMSNAAQHITNPVNPRPVIVRGHARQGYPWDNPPKKGASRKAPIVNTPLYSKNSNRGRRQFYLTMDQYPGTELRLPAVPVFHPGWRLLSGLIAIAMLVGIYSMMNSPYFQVSSAEVQGLQRITAQEVNETLNLQDESVINIDGKAIEDQLVSKYPELTHVQVTVTLPNYVTVSAVERTPVMAVQKGDSITWIDAEGVMFPQRGDAGPLLTIHTEDDLPLASASINPALAPADGAASSADQGSDTPLPVTAVASKDQKATGELPRVDPSLIMAAEALSQKLPPDSTLVYDRLNGLGWTDPQGTQVYIGKDTGQFETKFTLYQQIAQYLADQGQKATLIDVEQISAPFYRLEQQNNGG
jgi:cell division protein FtsQ